MRGWTQSVPKIKIFYISCFESDGGALTLLVSLCHPAIVIMNIITPIKNPADFQAGTIRFGVQKSCIEGEKLRRIALKK